MLAGGTQEEAAIAAKNVARQILMEEMNSTNTSSRGGSSGGSGSGGDNSRGYKSASNSGRIGQRSALTLSSNAASNATVSRLAMKNTTTKSGGSGRSGGSSKGGKGKGGLLSKFRNKRKNKKKSKGDDLLPGIAEVSLDSHDEGRDELSSSKNDYNTNNSNNGRDEREESSPDTTTASPEEQQQEDTVFKQFSNAADTVVELVEKLSGEAPVVNNDGGGENSSDFSSYGSSQDYYVDTNGKNREESGKNTEGNVEGRMEDLVNLNFVMNAVEKEIFPVATQEKEKKNKQHQKTFSSDDSKELRASTRREEGGGGFLSQLCGALFSVEDGICSLGRGESQSFCSNTQSASYEQQQHQQKSKTSVPSASLPSVSLDNSSRRHMDNITNDMDMGVEMSASNNNHHHKSISWADSHNNQRDDRYGLLNIDNTNSTNDSSLIKAMARGMVNGSRSFVQSTRPPQAIETTFDGSTFETKDTYGTNKTSKGTNSKIVGGGEQLVNVEGGVDLVSKNSGKGGAESVSSKVKTILMNKNPFKSSNQCIGGGYQCGTSGYYVPPGGEEAGVEVFEGGENADSSNINWRDMVQDTAPRDLDRGRSMSQQQAASGQYQASSGYQTSPQSQFQHPTPQEAREYIQMHNPQVSNLPITSQGQQQQVVASQLPIVNREPSHIPKVNSNFSVESDDDRQDRYAGMPEEEQEQYHPQPQHNMVQMQDGHVMRSDLAYDTNTMVGQQRVEMVTNSAQPVAATPPTVTELVMSNTSLFSGLLGDSETGSVEQHVDGNGNGGQQGYRMQPVRMHMPTSNKVPFNARQQYSEIMQIPPFNPNKQRMMSNSNNHQPLQYQQQEYHPQQQVGMTTRDTQSQINVMGPPSGYHVQQQQQYYQSQYQQPPFNHGVDPNSGVYYEERNPQPTSPHAYHGGYRTFAA